MKRKTKTAGDVYRAAARALELYEQEFPCIAVEKATPGGFGGDWLIPDTLAGRFICTMAPNGPYTYSRAASDAYIESFRGDWEFNEHSILALCFAAAMADTGDLP